jgi:hypothetical protein
MESITIKIVKMDKIEGIIGDRKLEAAIVEKSKRRGDREGAALFKNDKDDRPINMN